MRPATATPVEQTAQNNDLLYASEVHGTVFVFAYPQGYLEARLTGFSEPGGLCVDSKQDVLIPDLGNATISEYAHGNSSPITVLQEPMSSYPTDCSIDPVTGDLAVANYNAAGGANVEIFPPKPGGWGTPKTVSDPQITIEGSCGYDERGNLYIDGLDGLLANAFAMLPRGSSSFVNVTLPNSIRSYEAIRWDGAYITLADASAGIIYRLDVSGAQGRIVGETRLRGSATIGYYSYYRADSGHVTLIGPNENSLNVAFWAYPGGGSPTKFVPIQGQAAGTAVSRGSP